MFQYQKKNKMDLIKKVAAVFLVFSPLIVYGQGNGLSFDYYSISCPQLETIVRDEMESAIKADPSIPAALLRLVFHDCSVGGCDGSILLDMKDKNHRGEIDSAKNFGIRNRELIDQIKLRVEDVCPKQVSCADILALAGRDSVAIAGGPTIKLPLGRRDTIVARSRQEADVGLPPSNVTLAQAIKVFGQVNGFSVEELVALLGSHTLGVTHCDGIIDRLYENQTVDLPPNEVKFVNYLKRRCPQNGSNRFTTTFNLDRTPNTFDTEYFKTILNGHGLISLDAEFARDPKSVSYVKKFANDKEAFYQVFAWAFVKLSSLGVVTGNKGVIREECNVL